MNKAEAQARLDILRDCLRQLPDDTRILTMESSHCLYGDKPAVHIYGPLPSFDVRVRSTLERVRYSKRINYAYVFWLVDEPLPESV